VETEQRYAIVHSHETEKEKRISGGVAVHSIHLHSIQVKHDSTLNIYGAYMFTRLTVPQLRETCDLMLERLTKLDSTDLH